MRAGARAEGAALVEAERTLDALYASKKATRESVDAQLGRIEALRARLRGLHLNAHLEQAALLTRHGPDWLRAGRPYPFMCLQNAINLQVDCVAACVKIDDTIPGIEEGLNAAAAIGDDRMQRRSQGYVIPDAFTHGSAEQRMRWFSRGLKDGRVAGCNSFDAKTL